MKRFALGIVVGRPIKGESRCQTIRCLVDLSSEGSRVVPEGRQSGIAVHDLGRWLVKPRGRYSLGQTNHESSKSSCKKYLSTGA